MKTNLLSSYPLSLLLIVFIHLLFFFIFVFSPPPSLLLPYVTIFSSSFLFLLPLSHTYPPLSLLLPFFFLILFLQPSVASLLPYDFSTLPPISRSFSETITTKRRLIANNS